MPDKAADAGDVAGLVEKHARLGGAEEAYIAVAPDLDADRRLIRVSRHAAAGGPLRGARVGRLQGRLGAADPQLRARRGRAARLRRRRCLACAVASSIEAGKPLDAQLAAHLKALPGASLRSVDGGKLHRQLSAGGDLGRAARGKFPGAHRRAVARRHPLARRDAGVCPLVEAHGDREIAAAAIRRPRKRRSPAHHGDDFLIESADTGGLREFDRRHAAGLIDGEGHRGDAARFRLPRSGWILLEALEVGRNQAVVVGRSVGTAAADAAGGVGRRRCDLLLLSGRFSPCGASARVRSSSCRTFWSGISATGACGSGVSISCVVASGAVTGSISCSPGCGARPAAREAPKVISTLIDSTPMLASGRASCQNIASNSPCSTSEPASNAMRPALPISDADRTGRSAATTDANGNSTSTARRRANGTTLLRSVAAERDGSSRRATSTRSEPGPVAGRAPVLDDRQPRQMNASSTLTILCGFST